MYSSLIRLMKRIRTRRSFIFNEDVELEYFRMENKHVIWWPILGHSCCGSLGIFFYFFRCWFNLIRKIISGGCKFMLDLDIYRCVMAWFCWVCCCFPERCLWERPVLPCPSGGGGLQLTARCVSSLSVLVTSKVNSCINETN